MPSNPYFSYASVGLEAALESTKDIHNGNGHKEFLAARDKMLAGEMSKKELMELMNIKAYDTLNRLLMLANLEDKEK